MGSGNSVAEGGVDGNGGVGDTGCGKEFGFRTRWTLLSREVTRSNVLI